MLYASAIIIIIIIIISLLLLMECFKQIPKYSIPITQFQQFFSSYGQFFSSVLFLTYPPHPQCLEGNPRHHLIPFVIMFVALKDLDHYKGNLNSVPLSHLKYKQVLHMIKDPVIVQISMVVSQKFFIFYNFLVQIRIQSSYIATGALSLFYSKDFSSIFLLYPLQYIYIYIYI